MTCIYSAATIASLAIVPPCLTVLAFLTARLACIGIYALVLSRAVTWALF